MNVAIIDDEQLFREGIATLLTLKVSNSNVFDFQNAGNFLDFLSETEVKIDIALLDINMPDINGVELSKELKKNYANIKIIVLSSHFSHALVSNMIDIGASAYLKKNTSLDLMQSTIEAVMEKGFYYGDDVMEIIQQNIFNKNTKVKSVFDKNFVSKREKEVLELICKQYTTEEIAEELFISPRTVEGHRNNMLQKTNTRNVAGLVVFAIQNKIINIENKLNH